MPIIPVARAGVVAAAVVTAAVLAAGVAMPSVAATLRTSTTLAAPVVLLSDLFDDAGPEAARVLGSGPAPGARIVVGSAQLGAIARQFGVDWRPSSSADRSVLERPGRPLPRDTLIAPLRAALSGVGAAEDADIEISGFTAPMIAPDAHPDLGIEQVDYDGTSGRFSATILLSGNDVDTQRLNVSGRLEEMIEVPVLVRTMKPGAIIAAEDLKVSRVPASLVHTDIVRTEDEATGHVLKHGAPPGQPIALADVARPNAVLKSSRVGLELQAPGLAIAGEGIAMESGALGDTIRVLNPTSRAIVEARVIGPDHVRVLPGSGTIVDETGNSPGLSGAAQVAAR